MFIAEKTNLLDEETMRRMIRMVMKDKNYTLTELSKRSGVSRKTISSWLNGKSSIMYTNLYAITRILHSSWCNIYD